VSSCCGDRSRRPCGGSERSRRVVVRRRSALRPALLTAAFVIAVSPTVAVPGRISAAADPAVELEIARLERDGLSSAAGLDASDSLQSLERDRQLDRARRARSVGNEILSKRGDSGSQGQIDPLFVRALVVSIDGYTQALSREARILSGEARSRTLDERSSPFPAIWNEAVGHLLEVLERQASLWRRLLSAPQGEVDLPVLLLSLCMHDAFQGDTYALPRDCLFPRMVTLPESLAACCLNEGRCSEGAAGSNCVNYVAGLMAESVEEDAIAGFRYGGIYWSVPAGDPPRNRSKDGRVAAASVRYLVELLEAGEIDRPGRASPERDRTGGDRAEDDVADSAVRPLADSEALDLIRGFGRLWPSSIDPFNTVPGLRNPRMRRDGSLLCDVALYRPCLESLNVRSREWLLGRLTQGRKVVLVDPR
jgi:hypothetical protein